MATVLRAKCEVTSPFPLVLHDPPLFFNNQIVSRINDHKHLGLTLNSRLSFTKLIAEKTAEARKGIGIIRYLSSYVTLDTLDQINKLFVRPHLDYCDIIFHIPQKCSIFVSSINLTSLLMNSLESTQYRAAAQSQEHGEEQIHQNFMKN